ncbi:hypothetical protein B6N13_14505 [Marinomonas sp. UCMA 3892]|uniref:hypothetical protein n=1 Tax=unclassified Marinomonas TaxID=196814 RepID=UPI00146D919E|nr:hypothetical protein [Marinomonas sp. UCMA 3892]NLU99287.1 hypothetical protein [Marinomonas sp. UCMA 3892]
MKAIKLASVFAVTAVAAAVSTATFAADAIITGEAGVEYVQYHGSASDTKGDTADGTDLGELELHVDTGIVYAELEFKTTGEDEGTDINMEKLYVKQGAVSFGRFDGSVATGAFMGMDEIFGGVDTRDNRVVNKETDNTGIRYKVTPEFTVAVEASGSRNVRVSKAAVTAGGVVVTPAVTSQEKIDSEIGVALSYVKDFGVVKLGVSAGAIGDTNAYNIGAQTTVGMATISANYGAGKTIDDVDTDSSSATTDVEQAQINIALAVTDALTLTYEYARDLENSGKAGKADHVDATYFIAEYAVGDLTYYYKNYNGDAELNSDIGKNIVGVKVFF